MFNSSNRKTIFNKIMVYIKKIIQLPASLMPYISGLFFVILPLCLSSHSMWDGSMIEYAAAVGDLSGLENWFYESGWFLQYWQIFCMYKISGLVSVNYSIINIGLVTFSLFLIIHECMLLASNQLKLPTYWAIFAGMCIAIFPTWNLLLSSVMTFHFSCVAIGILGVRLFHDSIKIKRGLGFVFVILSLNYSGMLAFLPILSYLHDISESEHENPRWMPSIITVITLCAAILMYILARTFYPPFGLYRGYNSIIDVLSLSGFILVIRNSFKFFTFLYPLIIGVFFIVVPNYIYKEKLIKTSDESKKSNYLRVNLVLMALLVSAIFPFVMVGKWSSITSVYGWDGRQAFVLAPVLCLFYAATMYLIYRKSCSAGKFCKWVKYVASALIVIQCFLLLGGGFIMKFNQQAFENKLISEISIPLNSTPGGRLQIVASDVPIPGYTNYEANYLIFRATGRTLWWTSIEEAEKPDSVIPKYMDRPEYQKKYIFNPPSNSVNCSSVFIISSKGYKDRWVSMLQNISGVNSSSIVKLEKINVDCGSI